MAVCTKVKQVTIIYFVILRVVPIVFLSTFVRELQLHKEHVLNWQANVRADHDNTEVHPMFGWSHLPLVKGTIYAQFDNVQKAKRY